MKILTAEQMRAVDKATIDAGIPSLILMENAAHRVVEFLAARYGPLSDQHILVLCGKGNNGGDGLAIARQIFTRFAPRKLEVVITCDPGDYRGDAMENYIMWQACGQHFQTTLLPTMWEATLIIDAMLGTGIKGPAQDKVASFIEQVNSEFPNAKIVSVDLPSGMASDSGDNEGPCVIADATVTFTAPKVCHAVAPNCDRCGEIVVAPIGTPPSLLDNPAFYLSLIEPSWFTRLFQPRPKGAHKGDFGHVLLLGGSVGKAGAAAMSGMAALRAGAGLVTVCSAQSAIRNIANYAPELMTEALPETEVGSIGLRAYPSVEDLCARKSIVGLGPGLGTHPDTAKFARTVFEHISLPMVVDADAIRAVAEPFLHAGGPRIYTPHPGEMTVLAKCNTEEVQSNRLGIARAVALDRDVTIVLKGQRTVIAFPDGRVWVNPTGSAAMAKGGSGDILTGLICGLMSQFPSDADFAIGAAVWLHGRAGELGAAALSDKSVVATDLLRFLPEAMRELQNVHR